MAAELRNQEMREREERLEKEKAEREVLRKQKEEEKRREVEWERHTAQLKKRASTVDDRQLEAWLTHTCVHTATRSCDQSTMKRVSEKLCYDVCRRLCQIVTVCDFFHRYQQNATGNRSHAAILITL